MDADRRLPSFSRGIMIYRHAVGAGSRSRSSRRAGSAGVAMVALCGGGERSAVLAGLCASGRRSEVLAREVYSCG